MGGEQHEQRWYVARLEANEVTSLMPEAWHREGWQVLLEEVGAPRVMGARLWDPGLQVIGTEANVP